MDFNKKEQKQTAGDNAIQTQFGNLNNCNVTINNQEIIRTIASEVCSKEMLNIYRICTHDAIELANKRDNMFSQTFIPRLEKLESAVNALKEPSFQYMIQSARETAAKTDKQADWDMLSELLACHIEKGNNKKIDSGINRAIKIVNEIDNDSLCALTIVCSILNIAPINGDIREGLSAIDKLYDSILDVALPTGYDWIDQLNILGAINMLTGNFYKIEKLLSNYYDGYICVGIKIGSKEHDNALRILEQNNISQVSLVENECMDGYLRLNVVQISNLNENLKPIVDLYVKTPNLVKDATDNFIKIWDSYRNLKLIREWFEAIPVWFRINSVGMALAQTNAKRCYKGFPDLIH